MFFALDDLKNRIDAEDANKMKIYYCPTCGCKVIPRQGEHNVFHYAHPKGLECVDTWNYDMSEWHRSWQKQFPGEMQEIVINSGKEKHRADVLIESKKLVIEFQHSNLSSEEFNKRNQFYNSCGYRVVWLFDLIEKYESEQISVAKYSNQYLWKWGSTTFSGFCPSREKRVSVYFQFGDSGFAENNMEGVIERFSWMPEDNERIKIFRTDENVSYTPFQFIAFLRSDENDKADKKRNVETVNITIPQDSIYGVEFDFIMLKSESREIGSLTEGIMQCLNKNTLWIRCSKNLQVNYVGIEKEFFVRYRAKGLVINEISAEKTDCIEQITSALKKGNKQILAIENILLYGRSIPEIMKELNSGGAGVVNVNTGKDFYVSNSDYFKRDNIKSVKGRPKLNYGYKYSNQCWEIFGALRSEWIVKFC